MDERKKSATGSDRSVYRYEKGKMRVTDHQPVREFPLQLIVNGRELATLITSPHDLRYLVAGFLRLEGFVEKIDDFLMLSVCEDFGIANVIVRGELPEKLKPSLTSGCGTGITFNLQHKIPEREKPKPEMLRKVLPDDIFSLMQQLSQLSGAYKASGGIHSAAVAVDKTILLCSEDIGRHNTLDRIAGEALLKGIELSGTTLITSGRISTEMVTKAAVLGIALIASRTSPTDMAVRLADEAGITLIGYVRGGGFNVYTHPESLATFGEVASGVTAVILAGGNSTRMKSNKALLPYRGERFIERIYRQLAEIFPEVILVTNTPEMYRFLPCRTVSDFYPDKGSLAGIHSGLVHSSTPYIFVVACDMPDLNELLIRHLVSKASGTDVVIPESEGGLEPLHAVYGKGCLQSIEATLSSGKRRIVACFDQLKVNVVSQQEIAAIDPEFLSFRNINTPEEYFQIRQEGQEVKQNKESEPLYESQ
ncbi:MAG: formate dehydrogenase accessory sulfurtransferase FdhD [Deltaproteobacteria bacterium]